MRIIRAFSVVAIVIVLLTPAAAQDGPLVLAEAGQARAVIITGEGSVAQYAASELEKYLEQISGAKAAMARIFVGPSKHRA